MIPEEEVLAMCGINLFPVFQSQLYGRKWRMDVVLVFDAVSLEETQYFSYSVVHISICMV
jgi:hypothetical protein